MKDFIIHNASLIISGFSLFISIVSLFFTYRVNRLDYKLKQAQVKELDERTIEENTCALDASFVPIGSNKVKRLKVMTFNRVVSLLYAFTIGLALDSYPFCFGKMIENIR